MRKSDDARCKISTSACKANLDRVVRPPKLRISPETVWDCAKCKMLNRDQRRCGLVCTQFRHIAWFKIQTKEDTVRTRWSLQPSWGASLPPASNIPVPLCPCNPIHPGPEESGAMNVDEISRVTWYRPSGELIVDPQVIGGPPIYRKLSPQVAHFSHYCHHSW